MSVARAQAEITEAEFRMWLAYYKIDPFGSERDDMRAVGMRPEGIKAPARERAMTVDQVKHVLFPRGV